MTFLDDLQYMKLDHLLGVRSKLKGFSRLIKRVLDIDSIPKAHPSGTKRMYMIDTVKFDEYKKRYADEPEKTV